MFQFPKGADWMTLEESADRRMDQLFSNLVLSLEESCVEDAFFQKLDFFYEEAKKIIPRTSREEFDRITLLVIEGIIRKKFHESSYEKYLSWKFDLHKKKKRILNEDLLPSELAIFIQERKPRRVEGVLDFYVKKQSPRWFNPYVDEVGVRPDEIYEIKILYKDLAMKFFKSDPFSGLPEAWARLFDTLRLDTQEYIVSVTNQSKIILATRAQQNLSGKSVEFLLWV